MDVEAAREFGERIDAATERLVGEFDSLDSMVRASGEFWRGPDGDAFRASWTGTYSSIAQPGFDRLRACADRIRTDSDEQDEASSPDSEGTHSEDAHGRTAAPWADADGEPNVDPEVAEAWEAMSDEDREKVAREMIDDQLRSYGIDPSTVEISFEDTEYLGYWSESERKLVINPEHLRTPGAFDTIAHEVRHAAQHEYVRQTEPTGWWFWRDDKAKEYEQIERDHNISRRDIDLWRENNKPGKYISPPDPPGPGASDADRERYRREFEYYEGQPVEVDARGAGKRYAEGIDMSDLEEYKKNAGVS